MTNKGKKFPPESLTRAEVQAILTACGDSWTGKRNQALIVLMWRAGLRLGETLALRHTDIDWESQTIRVLHGKGDKARTVGIDKSALATIQAYLNATPRTFGPGDLLIRKHDGGKVSQDYVRQLMKRLERKAGISKRVHAHLFRHTFAVELARERVPMPHIQRLLGHSSLAVTSVYLASLSPEEALDAVRGREW